MNWKLFKNLISLTTILCVILVLMPTSGQCGPVPKLNEHEKLMPNVPQWHCLRYFRHDLLMMRRCRHLRVPTAPRLGNVKKLSQTLNYNFVDTTNNKNSSPNNNSNKINS